MFHLCQAVERALISQVVAAVESTYLAALRNKNTGQYGDSILKILQHLSTTYVHNNQRPKKWIFATCNSISHPVDIVFNAIDDLIEMSEYSLMPISSSQAVNLAYVLFVRNLILLQDLWAWNRHSAEFYT